MSKHPAPHPDAAHDDDASLPRSTDPASAPWAVPDTPTTALRHQDQATGPGPGGEDGRQGQDRPARQTGVAALVPTPSGRAVTCPECGAVATVTVNRREAHDFCAHCDFPLFWTPSQVVLGDEDLQAQAALRRLPGTAGRTTVGSLACPHCFEANPVSGVLCVRCGGDLHPVAAAPAPPLPAPEPVPDTKRHAALWWWLLGGATLVLLALVVWALARG